MKRLRSTSIVVVFVFAVIGFAILLFRGWLISPRGLHWAIRGGHPQAVCWILNHGVDADSPDQRGITPLMEAALAGDVKAAECLVVHRADVNATSHERATPLYFAITAQRDEMVQFLLDRGARVDAITPAGGSLLLVAASICRLDYTSWLLQRGAEIDSHDASGNTALSWACQSGANLDLVRRLVEHGANVNIASGPDEMTPLMYAAQSCKPEVLRFLVEHGALTDPFDLHGYDALTRAAFQGRADNLRELVNLGSKVNRRNQNGLTPILLVAASAEKPSVLQTLIDCGADVTIHGPRGLTARQEAEEAGRWQNATILATAEHRMDGASTR
jgi:ankyrin repeat protein